MINFPIFERLEIKEYGLYPGTDEHPGIEINFESGLTLILGANGLGKTTLITILFRMLTGAFDLPKGTLDATELGGSSLDATALNPKEKRMFANRVQDLAENATATLKLRIAKDCLTISRKLNSLELVSLQVNNSKIISDEAEYQTQLSKLSGVPSFGDWLLILRHMVFYFEDRRELVWDMSAQRHIFRMMFLSPQDAENWYTRERAILKLDSQYRNDIAAFNRLKNRINNVSISSDEKPNGNEASLRRELEALRVLQNNDQVKHEELISSEQTLDNLRHDLRKKLLTAEKAVDTDARALETQKLLLLKSYFPTSKHTATHLYSILISQDNCAVCGNEATATAKELSERIEALKCIICGTEMDPQETSENVVSFSKGKIKTLNEELESTKKSVSALKKDLSKVSKEYDEVAQHLTNLRVEISDRAKRIQNYEKVLPKEHKNEKKENSQLTEMDQALSTDRAELSRLAGLFKDVVAQANNQILKHSNEIKEVFGTFANGFLAENALLKWSPIDTNVGQTGITKVTFPAFALEMSGSNFTVATARKGPDAVSESQREFIDLAFRMALIQVAGEGTGGSLVIDAPESSLDAFFVKRAANVLSRFGRKDSNNRLVIASNLVDGQLLPELIRANITNQDKDHRLVNLMDIAVPTAALRDNREEYESELQKILSLGGLHD